MTRTHASQGTNRHTQKNTPRLNRRYIESPCFAHFGFRFVNRIGHPLPAQIQPPAAARRAVVQMIGKGLINNKNTGLDNVFHGELFNPLFHVEQYKPKLVHRAIKLWYIVPVSIINRQVCRCDQCSHEWIPETKKLPTRCPSRNCRSIRWNATGRREMTPQSSTNYDQRTEGDGFES